MSKKKTLLCFQFAMALDELCAAKPYEEISVEDICTEAELSRSTFYRCFKSKAAIPAWWQRISVESSIGQIGRTVNWRNGLLMSYDAWVLMPRMNEATKGWDNDTLHSSYIMPLIKELLLETLRDIKKIELTRELLFQLDFYISSNLFHQNSDWSIENSGLEPADIVDLMIPCIPRDLFAALDEPVNPQPAEQLSLKNILSESSFSQ